ncbi:MAG: DUF2917 domain-containing protein [Burkholderiaceae bacterium]|nr:DUF2917 domain-containing protein [Burkholderiaceae bacterium]
MLLNLDHPQVRLHQRQTIRLHDQGPVHVACDDGSIWITRDGDVKDIILSPGQSVTICEGGALLISALADSRVQLDAPPTPCPPRVPARRPGLMQRMFG